MRKSLFLFREIKRPAEGIEGSARFVMGFWYLCVAVGHLMCVALGRDLRP